MQCRVTWCNGRESRVTSCHVMDVLKVCMPVHHESVRTCVPFCLYPVCNVHVNTCVCDICTHPFFLSFLLHHPEILTQSCQSWIWQVSAKLMRSYCMGWDNLRGTGARHPMRKVFLSLMAVNARRSNRARICWPIVPPQSETIPTLQQHSASQYLHDSPRNLRIKHPSKKLSTQQYWYRAIGAGRSPSHLRWAWRRSVQKLVPLLPAWLVGRRFPQSQLAQGCFADFRQSRPETESSTEIHEFSSIVPDMLYRIQESVSSCSFLLPWSPLATFKKTWTMVSKGITQKEKTSELCPSRKKNNQGWIMAWGTLTSQIHVYYRNIPRHGQKNKKDCIKLSIRLVSTCYISC